MFQVRLCFVLDVKKFRFSHEQLFLYINCALNIIELKGTIMHLNLLWLICYFHGIHAYYKIVYLQAAWHNFDGHVKRISQKFGESPEGSILMLRTLDIIDTIVETWHWFTFVKYNENPSNNIIFMHPPILRHKNTLGERTLFCFI